MRDHQRTAHWHWQRRRRSTIRWTVCVFLFSFGLFFFDADLNFIAYIVSKLRSTWFQGVRWKPATGPNASYGPWWVFFYFFLFFISLFVFLLGANLCFVAYTACKLHTTWYQGGRYMSTMTEKSPNMSWWDFVYPFLCSSMLVWKLFHLQFLIYTLCNREADGWLWRKERAQTMSLYGKYFLFIYVFTSITTTRKGPKMCLGLGDFFFFFLNLSFIICNSMLISILFDLQFLI